MGLNRFFAEFIFYTILIPNGTRRPGVPESVTIWAVGSRQAMSSNGWHFTSSELGPSQVDADGRTNTKSVKFR